MTRKPKERAAKRAVKKAKKEKKATLAAQRPRSPTARRAKADPARKRPDRVSRDAALSGYEIPEPRFLLAFGVLSVLFVAVAMVPTVILSRVPGDLANRRGGLGFTGLLIAFVPLLLVIGSALTQ